jgi:multiple sugar transport system ATP-binding protein
MVEIAIDHLSKNFGKVTAVNDLSLTIKDKEFAALLGPSGCGKTTTLRCIAGLEKGDEGHIHFGDRDVTDLPPVARNVAMVFQSYALFPHMNVFDNIAFPLKIKKWPKDEIKRKVREIAELLKISELLDRKPSQTSGGQAQRVALGRALISNPDVFLMDEPLANLDAKLRVLMRSELKKMQKEIGVTTIFVTHDQLEAMSMADRIAVMDQGSVRQYATPEDIYESPKHLFVADFIGSPSTNLLKGSVTEKDGRLFIDFGPFILAASSSLETSLRSAGTSEVVLGIKPEHVLVDEERPDREIVNVDGLVYTVEPVGLQKLITARIDDLLMKIVTNRDFRKIPDEKVSIGFDTRKIYFFDTRTGGVIGR